MLVAILKLLFIQYIGPIETSSEKPSELKMFFEAYPLFLDLVGWSYKWMIGMMLAPDIRRWVLSLWPSIEFDFGPDHLKIEKMRRLRVSIFMFTAIIPLSISIISNLISKIL